MKSFTAPFLSGILSASLLCGMAAKTLAQTPFNPGDLSMPFIPGERAVSFSVNAGSVSSANIEVWVFYSKTQSELSVLNSSSFGSSRHYGKAVMVRTGNTIGCTFVFPHPHHPLTPNADLFGNMRNVSGIITEGYPTPNLAPGGIVLPDFISSPVTIDFNPITVKKDECIYFRVYKRVRSGNTYTDQLSEIKKFRVPDTFNIGIAGDSYGAGEGAPDDEFELTENNSNMWSSCKCHRSRKSGLMRGVKKFIARFPEFAVDYSFQACSGSVTWNFFDSEQKTNEHPVGTRIYATDCGGVRNDIQFEKIREDLITNRKHEAIQMLLMSGGGNNTGFGDVVITYLISPGNLALFDAAGRLIHADVLGEFTDKIEGLAGDYASLDNGINDFFTEVRPIIGITTYPDPTKGLKGRCGQTSLLGPDYPCARYETDFTISPQAEYEMISDRFVVPLNQKVRGTTNLGWNVIDVETMAGTHGICNCDDPYINTIGSSYEVQGDIFGIAHPNDDGYDEMYKDKVFSFVVGKYDTYRSGYALAIALGIRQAPVACTNNVIRFFDTLTLVRRIIDLSPLIGNISGFGSLKNELTTINLRKEEVNASEINTALRTIQNDKYKKAFNSFPLKSTIIKQSFPTRPVKAPKPMGAALIKLKKDLFSYVQSAEFKGKQAAIRKQTKPARKKAVNPLDNLFNN